MNFTIKDFFNKRDQIRRKLRIWSHLPKKHLMEDFFFCVQIIIKTSRKKESVARAVVAQKFDKLQQRCSVEKYYFVNLKQ